MTPIARFRRRGRLVLVPLALALTLVVAACGSGGTAATPTPTFGPVNLDGTDWLLVSYMTADGTNYTVPMAVTPTALFSGGTIDGFAGCNKFNGPYVQDGEKIKIGPIGATKVACDQPLAVVEAAYLQALSVVDKAVAAGDTLRMSQTGGFTGLEFVRASN
jgi:heat shock protein HslJ